MRPAAVARAYGQIVIEVAELSIAELDAVKSMLDMFRYQWNDVLPKEATNERASE